MIVKLISPNKIVEKGTKSILRDDKYPLILTQLLFLDIETIPNFSKIDDYKEMIIKKASNFYSIPEQAVEQQHIEDFVRDRGALYPELAQIICISTAFLSKDGEVRMKSYISEDEKELLTNFNILVNMFSRSVNKNTTYLCGHNIKFFDVPMIFKRMIYHNIHPAQELNTFGKKPWDMKYVDTMDVWKAFGENLSSSLNSFALFLGIPTKKDSALNLPKYFKDKDFDKIVSYCEHDVDIVFKIISHLSENLMQYDFVPGN